MSSTFVQLRNTIITRALRLCGALAQKQLPSSDQISEGTEAFNALLNHLQDSDTTMWTQQQTTQPLVASSEVTGTDGLIYTCIKAHTAAATNRPITGAEWETYWKQYGETGGTWTLSTAYTCAAEFSYTSAFAVTKAFYRLDEEDYVLELVEHKDMFEKPVEFGIPTTMFFDRLNGNKAYLYPIPSDATGILHLLQIRFMTDVNTPSSQPDVPVTWVRALTYLLAADIADEMGMEINERQALQAKAIALWNDVKKAPYKEVKHNQRVRSAY